MELDLDRFCTRVLHNRLFSDLRKILEPYETEDRFRRPVSFCSRNVQRCGEGHYGRLQPLAINANQRGRGDGFNGDAIFTRWCTGVETKTGGGEGLCEKRYCARGNVRVYSL